MSLSEKAVLVSLSVSTWTARKLDKRVSSEVAANHAARQDAGRYNKLLVAEDAIRRVQQAARQARDTHYKLTLPWLDNGQRILTNRAYMDYMAQMREERGNFERAVSDFLSQYPQLVVAAQQRLGTMYRAEDYPDAGEIAGKFGMEFNVTPVPDSRDFRVALSDTEAERIRTDLEERVQQATSAAARDAWDRLHEVIGNVVERLSDPKAIFRDSLIGNVAELVNILPMLNLNDDPELERLRREAERKIVSLDPADLRQDKAARQAAARDAKGILDAMAGMYEAA